MMFDAVCYLCGSNNRSLMLAQEGHDPYLALVNNEYHNIERCWYVCNECGFVYRSPVLSDEERELLYERYEQDVFSDTDPDSFFDRIINLPPEESENYQKSIWLKETIQRHKDLRTEKNKLSMLDVGCGSGLLLKTLGDILNTNQRWGVELNPVYADLSSRRSGAIVKNAPFKSGVFGRKFDLVVLTKVLEHVPDPGAFVTELSADVVDGGYLFLEVPDIVDFTNLSAEDPRFYIPHLYYFSTNTLSAVVEQAGMLVLDARTIVTHRGRSYLQLLATKNDKTVEAALPPFDTPNKILSLLNK